MQLKRDRSIPQKALQRLSFWLHDVTSKYFDEQLSYLVTAAYELDGSGTKVSATSLKVLHSPGRKTSETPGVIDLAIDESSGDLGVILEFESEN